jgi:transaldolase
MPQVATEAVSPLKKMTETTPTCLWNDSASADELSRSLKDGAVGATCNPVIASSVLKADIANWRERIFSEAAADPRATEEEIGWRMVRQMSMQCATLLKSVFDLHNGRNGRMSIQTDPRLYRDAKAIVRQAEEFHALAPNMIVKIPVTRAGIAAIEEATYRGISINATVCFALSQCVQVAEAVERGFARREREGKDVFTMGPACTIMMGRLDDWLKIVAEKCNILLDPGYLEWAGVAVFKRTYALFQARGYRIRLLSAAFRNHMHWSELIGGDVIVSPPYAWQLRFNASDISVHPRIADPVNPVTVDELLRKFPDFRAAYEEDKLPVDAFDAYAPTRRTLRQFSAACSDLNCIIRDVLVPNPDTSL